MKNQSKSIAFRLTTFIIGVILLQALLMAGSLMGGGVLKQAKENAFKSLSSVVSSRRNFLELEMRNRWTNIDTFAVQISELVGDLSPEDTLNFDMSSLSDDLIAMLRTSKATGAYVILTGTGEHGQPALYFRDYDPVMTSYSNNDLYMIMGSSEVARDLKIPLDQSWRFMFEPDITKHEFYFKPYNNSSLSNNTSLLGYWSKPFKLFENDMEIMTYSMPLLNSDNEPIGIVGIELTLNYLTQFLPATDLQAKDSLGYMIVRKDQEIGALMPVFSGGALQKRLIDVSKPLELLSVAESYNVSKVSNVVTDEKVFASIDRLNLYAYNTPFENETWYLIGLMRESDLFSYVNRIQNILWLSLGLAVVVGIIGGIFFSYRFSKPIISLSKEVAAAPANLKIKMTETGILEVDDLARAMEKANNNMIDSASRLSRVIDMFEVPIGAFEMKPDSDLVYATPLLSSLLEIEQTLDGYIGKKEFLEHLSTVMAEFETEDSGTYRINPGKDKWVKIRTTRTDASIIGVVMDVTEDVLEKNQIKKDRDLDPLTKLLNRKAFQIRYEKWIGTRKPDTVAALLMFDLDHLKRVNDTYGHKWGDGYILKAVDLIKSLGNAENVVVGRRSGDEFVVLMRNYKEKTAIVNALEGLFESMKLSTLIYEDGTNIQISMSCGICYIDQTDLSYEDYLQHADDALYKAKHNGKGGWSQAQI